MVCASVSRYSDCVPTERDPPRANDSFLVGNPLLAAARAVTGSATGRTCSSFKEASRGSRREGFIKGCAV